MIEKLTISEDVIRLIPHFNFTETPQISDLSDEQAPRWGLDYNSIYGGSFLAFTMRLFQKPLKMLTDQDIPKMSNSACLMPIHLSLST